MPTKKQLRSSKMLRNISKERQKFPDLLLRLIKVSDLILEILDARFVEETRNQEIENLILNKGKKIIYVLNKADLTNKKELEEPRPYIYVSCRTRKGINELRNLIKMEAQRVLKENNHYERVQVGVIGYPNTGKSSVINLLKGKPSAGVGAQAGFTKGIQKIKLTSEILLLDSPGVIPDSKYSSENQAKMSEHAKVCARDYNRVKNPDIIINDLMNQYPKVFENFYSLNDFDDSEILFEKLGRQWNFLKKGNLVDTDKVARKILKDWQEGRIRV